MGRGSPLCAKLRERIVSQFKDNVSQRKIAKNLGLSPSTVHNIVKRFRESGEISVRKGQGRKPLLNVHDHRALRQYCLRNHHATMMDIATWAGSTLKIIVTQHSLPLHQEMQLEIVLCKEEGIYKFCAEMPPSSLGRSHLRWTERQWKRVLWSDESTFQLVFFGFYVPKKKTIQTVTNEKCKNQPLWWYGGASVPMAWVICIYVKVPLMQRLMLEFWRDICCRQDNDFSQELHVYFSRTMPGLILPELQQRGFIGIECVCLTGLPAVQICLLLKMYGASWRGESDNGDHGLLSSSSLVYTKNGQKFHLQNCNNWYLQFPNDYKV